MAERTIAVQVKDKKVGAPDVQQFAGATIGKHTSDTSLIFDSKGYSSEAKKEAKRIEKDTDVKIKFWNIGSKG